jgi:hypothetical protein
MILASSTPLASRQRGMSLMSLLFTAIIVAFLALLLIRAYPTVQEYLTAREAVNKVMRADPRPGSIPEIRRAFERQRQIEYTNSMISGNDLEIEAVADGFRVSFAYDKEVEILDPVFVLIKYRYTTTGR